MGKKLKKDPNSKVHVRNVLLGKTRKMPCVFSKSTEPVLPGISLMSANIDTITLMFYSADL